MTLDEIIDALDRITGGDGERDHLDADVLLLAALREAGSAAVADAYDRLTERAQFWAYA